MSSPLLSVKNLTTDIFMDQGIVKAVNDISFNLYQGKTLGIVGESGSGKSILCKSILKLIPNNALISEASVINFNGHKLNTISEKKFNKIRGMDISMIFQDPLSSLNPVMKIGKQIA
ncbi:MAG: ABC transporter ATP-binding protein, partial [Desulfobacteraceae bacterium]|nr:ABC transporter ATP-binding protein [Desulfobacteraceae bacterium]